MCVFCFGNQLSPGRRLYRCIFLKSLLLQFMTLRSCNSLELNRQSDRRLHGHAVSVFLSLCLVEVPNVTHSGHSQLHVSLACFHICAQGSSIAEYQTTAAEKRTLACLCSCTGVWGVGEGGTMTTLLHRHSEQCLHESRFTRYIQYFWDVGPPDIVPNIFLLYLYSFVWRSQLKPEGDFRKQLAKRSAEKTCTTLLARSG